jgi:hypothetical protein
MAYQKKTKALNFGLFFVSESTIFAPSTANPFRSDEQKS